MFGAHEDEASSHMFNKLQTVRYKEFTVQINKIGRRIDETKEAAALQVG